MSHFIFCFILVQIVGVSLEKREVVLNNLVLLFGNVAADSLVTEVSLHKNGAADPNLIVKWNINNGDITSSWRSYNYSKIFMDSNRNIWIANIDKTYEGKYHIQSSQEIEVEIVVISGISHDSTTARIQKDDREGSWNNLIIGIFVMIVVLVVLSVMIVVFLYRKYGRCQCKKKHKYQEHKDQEENKALMETLSMKNLGAEAEKIITCDGREMRPDRKKMPRNKGMLIQDVYNFLYKDSPFDPNCLE